MDTIPNRNAELKFQALMTSLAAVSGWTEKQRLELEMTRDLSIALLQTAETMCEDGVTCELFALMQKYAKVLDFMVTMLATAQNISPQTLRTLFESTGLHVDEAYPE